MVSHNHKASIPYILRVKILTCPVSDDQFALSCVLLTNKSTVTFSVVCHYAIATCILFYFFRKNIGKCAITIHLSKAKTMGGLMDNIVLNYLESQIQLGLQ